MRINFSLRGVDARQARLDIGRGEEEETLQLPLRANDLFLASWRYQKLGQRQTNVQEKLTFFARARLSWTEAELSSNLSTDRHFTFTPQSSEVVRKLQKAIKKPTSFQSV